MSRPNIVIVGAGIGGSALAALMRTRGLNPRLIDKNPSPPRHSYGITLETAILSPLVSALGLDEKSVMSQTKHPIISKQHPEGLPTVPSDASSVRVSRALFEDFLRQGLDVDWDCKVTSIDAASSPLSLSLEDGRNISADLVVAADGVHSSIRQALLPNQLPTVLPYAVYNGRRNVSLQDAHAILSKPGLNQSDGWLHAALSGNTRLAFGIYKHQDQATIDFTFSRPAVTDDRLHRPSRSNAGARDIPEELHEEVDSLHPKAPGFESVFASSSLRISRLLHWLMRQQLVPKADLQTLADKGIVLLGDAAHAQPILGGRGANLAIQDALSLSDLLAKSTSSNLSTWYDDRYRTWSDATAASEKAIKQMHSSTSSSL